MDSQSVCCERVVVRVFIEGSKEEKMSVSIKVEALGFSI